MPWRLQAAIGLGKEHNYIVLKGDNKVAEDADTAKPVMQNAMALTNVLPHFAAWSGGLHAATHRDIERERERARENKRTDKHTHKHTHTYTYTYTYTHTHTYTPIC